MGITKTFSVAGVVIRDVEGKYLLVQEKQQKAYGLWNLPAGKVEDGLSIEETAIKEAKEETGFDVDLLQKIKVFHPHAEHPVQHAYFAKIIGGELNFPPDEILDAKWFNFDEVKSLKDKLRGDWVLESIRVVERQR